MKLKRLKTYQFPKELVSRAKKRATKEDNDQHSAWGPFTITHKGEKFILKRVGIIRGRKPLRAVPTLRLQTSEYEWMLQPKCQTRKRWQIQARIAHLPRSVIGCDCHDGNVGRWRGINVVFDW